MQPYPFSPFPPPFPLPARIAHHKTKSETPTRVLPLSLFLSVRKSQRQPLHLYYKNNSKKGRTIPLHTLTRFFTSATLMEFFSLGLLYSFSGSRFLALLIAFRLPCLLLRNMYQRCTLCIALSSFMPRLASHSELSLPTLSLHLIIFTVASHDLI